MKAYDERGAEIRVGDRVNFVHNGQVRHDEAGEVIHIDPEDGGRLIGVRWDDGSQGTEDYYHLRKAAR